MSLSTWSLTISVIALLISLWSRIESFYQGSKQRRAELVRRLGDAFSSAQLLKNMLSDYDETLLEHISNTTDEMLLPHFKETQEKLKKEYDLIWKYVKYFENVIILFQNGKSSTLDLAEIEAYIARFNQRRILAEYDIDFVRNLQK